MKLHILSDVHLEFGKWPKHVDINAIDADVTILAGDIGIGLEGVEWALSIERPVVYVIGNHEFYGQRPMADFWRKAREKVEHTHVHLLENETLLLDDPATGGKIRFLGCTLWTDFAILGPGEIERCMASAQSTMSDYSSIYVTRRGKSSVQHGVPGRHGGDRLTPRKVLSLHHESRDFLESELAATPRDMGERPEWSKTVVVTHHAPHPQSLYFGKAIRTLDAAYASNLEPLMGNIDCWIHGHVHKPADYCVGGCRVLCNPRGYVGDAPVHEFDPALVAEV